MDTSELISETTPDGGTQTWTREDNFERRGWDVTHESQAGRTTRYEVSELDTGAVMSRQATVVQGGTEAEPEELSQMTRRLKSGIVLGETPDGTQTFTTEAADPVAGMLAPYTDFTRVLLPEDDLEISMVAQKLVEREDPEDSLSRISTLITRSGVDLDNDFQTRYVADSNTEWDPAEVETLVASTTYFDEIATRTETVTAEDRWTTAFYSERGELIRTEAGTVTRNSLVQVPTDSSFCNSQFHPRRTRRSLRRLTHRNPDLRILDHAPSKRTSPCPHDPFTLHSAISLALRFPSFSREWPTPPMSS